MLEQLRSILLTEDRAAVRRLENTLDDPERLAEKMAPVLEPRLELLKENFPAQYRHVVDKLIQERLQNSQEQIVEVIYPVLGSMVRKYIEHQFQLLKEDIEARLAALQAKMSFWKWLRAKFAGVSEAEMLLAASNVPQVEEIYLVERNTGLLIGHAARKANLDPESVGGMLTALKAFVEDAFQKGGQNLDYVGYDHYKILIENYRNCFLATLVQGSVSARERDKLSKAMQAFVVQEFGRFGPAGEGSEQFLQLSDLLSKRFLQAGQTLEV